MQNNKKVTKNQGGCLFFSNERILSDLELRKRKKSRRELLEKKEQPKSHPTGRYPAAFDRSLAAVQRPNPIFLTAL